MLGSSEPIRQIEIKNKLENYNLIWSMPGSDPIVRSKSSSKRF